VGYPLLLWLDPLALFAGLFRAPAAWSDPTAWVSIGVLLGILALSAARPGAWCGRLCPLGATLDFLARGPRMAWRVARPSGPVSEHRAAARRTVLGAALGIAWAMATKAARAKTPPPLRPPGAVDESAFTGVCLRCGNCLRVCPAGILAADASGLAGFLCPTVSFRDDYCREDCTRCTDVCPSGALMRLDPEEKRRRPLGVARVDMSLCLLADDRECGVCRTRCPYDAIALVFSEADYVLTPTIDPQRCPGCGACEAACPTQPVRAITVVRAYGNDA
jgi:ferredoxin-type protein NapF